MMLVTTGSIYKSCFAKSLLETACKNETWLFGNKNRFKEFEKVNFVYPDIKTKSCPTEASFKTIALPFFADSF